MDAPAAPASVHKTGKLTFLDEPVFDVETWHEGDQVVMRPTELDLIATADDEHAAAAKLGAMIFDLITFLHEDVDSADWTESERETLALLIERLAPLLVKHHEQRRRMALRIGRRRRLQRGIDWRMGPPSRPGGSKPVLSA
jgi:hypothetical protein